jgi:hypothetical protein
MTRAEFNLALQCDLRNVLNKHEKERKAVRTRDAVAAVAPVFGGQTRLEDAERDVLNAGEQLDMAIYTMCDRIYDLAKGEDSE